MKNNESGKKQNWFYQIGSGFLELVFPAKRFCPACQQEESYQAGLGKNCFSKIALITPPICVKCGRPQRLKAASQELCSQCLENKYYFSMARAVGLYEGALREYLAEIKYRYQPELADALGLLLVDWIKLHFEYRHFNQIIPIPIHNQKLMLRGYNQAEILANPLAKYLGIKLKDDIMIRDKITASQNALDKEERFSNINGAFKVVESAVISGAKVLLVDDILTTGATASEAARVLLRAGALDVKVLTLAVGVIDSQWL